MNTFLLIISTPDGVRLSEEVYELSLRGSEGDLAILANHIPFVTAVKEGECKVEFADESEKSAKISAGLLSVTKEKTILSVERIEWM